MANYKFYGWETAGIKEKHGLSPRDFYDLLSKIWCADTCAPRMRENWTPENKTLGQCSITAFLMQDLFGGRVYGVPLEDGNFHCFNDVDGCVFDLTSEQFGDVRLDYSDCPEQFRETHFAKDEKRERYEYLKERLFARLPAILETERLILRPWTESDAEECFKYASDPRVGPAAGWPPHTDVEYTRRVIRDFLAVPETYAIVLKETGLPVGSVGLHKNDLASKDDEAELGYWVGVPYWGRGIAPEASREMLRHAFEDLGLLRVWCGYYDGNEKSKRVQEKLGFVFQWSNDNVPVPQMGETRRGSVNLLKREEWLKNRDKRGKNAE